ncbi:MAG: multiheme c-type cytochrome [Flavobacteriales bacterium]
MSKTFILPLICSVFCLLYLCSGKPETFHTPKEIEFFRGVADTLHEGYNGLFAASGDCESCHGFDVNGIASNAGGEIGDVNVVDDWKTTMMAMSAKDPLWRAKVSHEVMLNPQYQVEIENKCTSCHASLGHFAAFHEGADHYSIEDLEADPWGLDGVSCLSCHQQKDEALGATHSGDMRFDTAKVAYGPYESPLTSPMLLETGYNPVYSEHIQDAGICASCHTLVTDAVDLNGEFTGTTFVEQATYHEWLNSTYDDQDISCQNCHMPNLGETPIFLIAGLNTVPRQDFSVHELVGANTFMLKLMKENKEELELVGSDSDFDQTIAATFESLESESVDVTLSALQRDENSASFSVTLSNLAGHKFPSGYPARRLFLQFTVTDNEGNTLFSSGETGENFILLDEDEEEVEPHYEVINSEDQVQIYEMAMGDVNGNFTTVLNRGYTHLKDNRLLPIGFSYQDDVIDTVAVHGNASTDSDYFGKGSAVGRDQITYEISLNDYFGELNVELNAFYQSVPHKWLLEMFEDSTDELEAFRAMYDEADKTPVLVGSETLALDDYVGVSEYLNNDFWSVFYDQDQRPIIKAKSNATIHIYNVNGSLMHSGFVRSGLNMFPLFSSGIYFITTPENSNPLKVLVR